MPRSPLRFKPYSVRTLELCCPYSSLPSLDACFGRYFRKLNCSNFLTKQPGHDDEVLSETLTLIPIESVSWAKGLKGRHCPESEVEKIVALTFTMRRLALRLSARAHASPSLALPEEVARLIDPVVKKAKEN